MTAPQPGFVDRLRGMIGRLVPGAEEKAFRQQADSRAASLIAAGDYDRQLANVHGGLGPREGHLVIVPMEGPRDRTWIPAGGNFFYEISQSAREFHGAQRVTVFEVRENEAPAQWHQRLIRFLVESQATHLLAQIESDPWPPRDPTWDVLWQQLSARWDGVFLGVMFDSAFRMVLLNARNIARINDRFVVVDICMPMNDSMVKGRSEVGPVNMPISDQTLSVLDAELVGIEPLHDVSFIGALYPYRIDLIQALRSQGIDVSVNPHRPDVTADFVQSRTNQPTYVDYMRGLAQSKITINFSESSARGVQQLKTRILEASAMGALVLTDDRDRSDRFWVPGQEIAYFAHVSDVPSQVASYLNDPVKLQQVQDAGRRKARSINVSSFWEGIDSGLAERGLPSIQGSGA